MTIVKKAQTKRFDFTFKKIYLLSMKKKEVDYIFSCLSKFDLVGFKLFNC